LDALTKKKDDQQKKQFTKGRADLEKGSFFFGESNLGG